MNIKLKLLRPFSEVVGKGEIEIDFNEKTINDLLKFLVKKYPKLKNEFFKDDNELTEYICIFINDKPLSALKGVDTILKNGDEVLFFMPISGG
jgi:MoaD family protein